MVIKTNKSLIKKINNFNCIHNWDENNTFPSECIPSPYPPMFGSSYEMLTDIVDNISYKDVYVLLIYMYYNVLF